MYLSDETAGERTHGSTFHTARVILTVLATAAVLYTFYDWLMSNSGGARLF